MLVVSWKFVHMAIKKYLKFLLKGTAYIAYDSDQNPRHCLSSVSLEVGFCPVVHVYIGVSVQFEKN